MTTIGRHPAVPSAHFSLSNQQVYREAQAVIARTQPTVESERRCDLRTPFPYLLRLMPVDASGTEIGDATVVVGKEIAERGLGFYHQHPLPHRRALVRLDHPQAGYFSAILDIKWCRFTSAGWYESGGRIIQWIEAGDASDLSASA